MAASVIRQGLQWVMSWPKDKQVIGYDYRRVSGAKWSLDRSRAGALGQRLYDRSFEGAIAWRSDKKILPVWRFESTTPLRPGYEKFRHAAEGIRHGRCIQHEL